MSLKQLGGIAVMISVLTGLFWGGQQFGRMAERSEMEAEAAIVDLTIVPTPVLANELLARGTRFDKLFDQTPEIHIHPIEGTIPVLVENVDLTIGGVLIEDSSLIIAAAHVHRPVLSEEESLDLIPKEDR